MEETREKKHFSAHTDIFKSETFFSSAFMTPSERYNHSSLTQLLPPHGIAQEESVNKKN